MLALYRLAVCDAILPNLILPNLMVDLIRHRALWRSSHLPVGVRSIRLPAELVGELLGADRFGDERSADYKRDPEQEGQWTDNWVPRGGMGELVFPISPLPSFNRQSLHRFRRLLELQTASIADFSTGLIGCCQRRATGKSANSLAPEVVARFVGNNRHEAFSQIDKTRTDFVNGATGFVHIIDTIIRHGICIMRSADKELPVQTYRATFRANGPLACHWPAGTEYLPLGKTKTPCDKFSGGAIRTWPLN